MRRGGAIVRVWVRVLAQVLHAAGAGFAAAGWLALVLQAAAGCWCCCCRPLVLLLQAAGPGAAAAGWLALVLQAAGWLLLPLLLLLLASCWLAG